MASERQKMTVGEVVAAFLERCGVHAAFGVISIHNMPILDAFGRRAERAASKGGDAPIRFVAARSEQGAVNMADAYARVSDGLGVAVSSTGTAAGNTCGAMVEALTAGTPVLHLTGQIESPYLDRELGYIHEARDQLAMMRAVSKAAFRVVSAETALGTLKEAARIALTAPRGPVSIEIPIDIQQAEVEGVFDFAPLPIAPLVPDAAALDRLAEKLASAKRPLLWLGGGARHAGDPVRTLVDMGFCVVTTVQGRGVIPEDDPKTLGAYNLYPAAEKFYAGCDALVVVGSRMRSNETLTYKLKLPQPLYRVDVDPRQEGRAYRSDDFVCGDSALVLQGLAERLRGRFQPDRAFADDLAATRRAVEKTVAEGLGPYAQLVQSLQRAAGRDFLWVRDVTVSNSTWGNRALRIFHPRDGVHALGGGIGQGVQMALGAALAADRKKTLCLTGDGGLQVNIGELATLVQEQANVLIVLMNDRGYGVIKNIQDAQYGGRRYYVDIHTPDFAAHAQSIGMPFERVQDLGKLDGVLAEAIARRGPSLVEIDMQAVGPFKTAFAGPPVRAVAADAEEA